MKRQPTSRCLLLIVAASAAHVCYAESDVPTISSLDDKTVELSGGREISGGANKARASYREFLDLVTDDPVLRAEAMRRLADLELEADESRQLGDAGTALPDPAQQGAVELFHQLLKSYPGYKRNDTVLYQLARAYEIGGDTDQALASLNELIDRYPQTELRPEVQFRRGEMLFLRRSYEQAEAAYADVVRHGESTRFYEQSLYKLGWTRFKLARHEESLHALFDLLDRKVAGVDVGEGKQRLQSLGQAERELIEDTFRVVSISFSYMDGPASIKRFLSKRGRPDYEHAIYRNLGDLYLEKERFVDAADAYDAFVRQDRNHPKAPLMQVEVIEAYSRGGFAELVLKAKKSFVDRYGMDQPFWRENSREDNEAAVAHLKDNLVDLARHHHAAAQQSGKRRDYRQAATWYRKYLEYFPGEPDSAATNFLLAEILFESRDFEEATLEYVTTAYSYSQHDKAAEAGYAALLSYREHEKSLKGKAAREWHQRYLDDALRFADVFPGHPESGTVLTTVSEDFFAQGRFDEAIAVAQLAVDKVPPVSTPLARTAWTVIAHSQFDLENYAAAETAYYQLRQVTPQEDVQARQDIRERIASSIYKQGELARDSGELESAFAHFNRIGDAVPGAEIAATAEYDAAAVLIMMGAWDRATPVLEQFRRNHPDSELNDDITRDLAVAYQETGRSAEAAAEFERIGNAPDSDIAIQQEALWKASELYAAAGQPSGEERVLSQVVSRFPEPFDESIEARARLLELAEQKGDAALTTQRLHEIVAADAAAGAQRSDRSRYLAARASLQLAEPVRRNFEVVKIRQPLAESMKLKKSLMESVLQAYGDAAAYGVAEVTTAATYRLAQTYQRFAADLMESERPAELDELALEEYELLLEEQIYPFEEKAIEIFTANANRAADGVYDEWIKRSFDSLATLVPARYAKMERSEDVVTAMY